MTGIAINVDLIQFYYSQGNPFRRPNEGMHDSVDEGVSHWIHCCYLWKRRKIFTSYGLESRISLRRKSFIFITCLRVELVVIIGYLS